MSATFYTTSLFYKIWFNAKAYQLTIFLFNAVLQQLVFFLFINVLSVFNLFLVLIYL